MSSSKLRKMCADAIFFSSLYLGIALCRDFGLQHIIHGRGIGAVKLSYFSCFSFLITASIIFVSNILVNIKDYNKEFLISDKSAKRFIIAYNASLAFFGLFIFVVVFFETFGLGFTPFHLLDLLGAAISVVVIIAVSEVFYSLFLARTNDSLAEEIVSGEINCEK
mgnify:CR=1 FL=1